MGYTVTSHDICVQGYERLRSQSEFLLATPVCREDATEMNQVIGEMVQDVECCDRPDTEDGEPFDYQHAKEVVQHYIKANWGDISRALAGLEDITDEQREADDWPGCHLYIYISTADNG